MKSSDRFRDIFGLAVRLLGLVFLYSGLKAVTPILDLGALETAGKWDLLTAILPIVFNLAVAWWLIGGGLLIRRAYPEAPRVSTQALPSGDEVATAESAEARGLTEMDSVEQKLAPLVEKSSSNRAA